MSFGSRGGYGAGGRGFNDSEASGGYGNENFGGGISRGRGGTNFGRYAVCNGNDGRGGSFSGGGGFGGRTGDFDINNGGDSGGYRGEGFGGRSGSNLGSSGRGGFGCRTDDFNNNRGSSDAASDRGNFGSGGGRGGGFGGRGRGFGGDFGSRGGFGGDRGSTSNETGHGGRGHLVGSNSCQFANQGDSFRPPSQGFNRGNDFSDGRAVSNPYASDKAENFDDRAPCPPTNNFIPEVRSVDELYKEDGENAENYRQVAEDDDEIHVSGPNIDHYAVLDWIDARFSEVLLRNIVQRSKYVRPRKIQAHVIPVVMDGRDVKGHAETGSGKTAAFMLPIIHKLMNMPYKESKPLGRPSPYAIIIEPTRELCCQVHEQGRKLAYETDVSVAKMYGQYKMSANLNELNMGCDILCATPGRLKHFITANLISVENVIFFVLDEADTLLESNFLDDIREIVNMGNFPDKESRQTMLFSATFPEMVQKLSTDVLKNNCVFVSNQKMVAANSRVIQCFESVACHDKKQKLFDMLMAEIETRKIAQPGGPELCRTLVFVRTKRDADLMSLFLTEKGIKATTINGDRMQSQREQALRDFRSNFVNVLVSTDVCARGIDIKDLDHVINMDLPNDAVTYVHRIGRTGRLKPGRATSFFDESSSNDLNIAKKLVEFVQGVGQEVPEFLQRAADGRGSGDYSSMVMQQASSGW